MCTQKPPHDYSEALYNRYRDVFSEYIAELVLPALQDHNEERLLSELHKRWNNHSIMTRWLVNFFTYLDRYYISRHSLPSLNSVGLICFRDLVYTQVKTRARDALLALIHREREGESIDGMLVKNVLDIFIRVGMESGMRCYEDEFEAQLLASTAAYYQKKAAAWIAEDSCPEYMVKAETYLKQEEARVAEYLHISTKPKLLDQVQHEVLQVYEQQLLEKENSGVSALLRDDKKGDLGRMCRLFSRIKGGLDPIAAAFKKHVEIDGMSLVHAADEAAAGKKQAGKKKPTSAAAGGEDAEQSFVRQVVELHDKYRKYVDECFKGASLFHKALKEAFETFCNKKIAGATMAQLMANYCNTLLKKGGEKLSDEATGVMLEKVVRLLSYLSDKDLFAEFYRKRLSARLLGDKSSVEHHERAVLAQLKQQCGAQFTSKMEGMVNDLQLARDGQQAFEEWRARQGRVGITTAGGVDMTVSVLTTGYWPAYKSPDLTLPKEMIDALSQYKTYYDDKFQNRKLSWIYMLGQVTVKFCPDSGTYDLLCASTFHAAVLLQFNEQEQLSFQEIQERLRLPKDDVARVLHSLVGTKHRILLKVGDGKTITPDDVYRINTGFKAPARRIKIALAAVVEDRKKVIEDVGKERAHAVDAAIVRTMKSRKKLGLSQIVAEVVQQLSKMFQAEVKMIKKQVESLIDREYVKRDDENPNVFIYLA